MKQVGVGIFYFLCGVSTLAIWAALAITTRARASLPPRSIRPVASTGEQLGTTVASPTPI